MSPSPSSSPTLGPSLNLSLSSFAPSVSPSHIPSKSPTRLPTRIPTFAPYVRPQIIRYVSDDLIYLESYPVLQVLNSQSPITAQCEFFQPDPSNTLLFSVLQISSSFMFHSPNLSALSSSQFPFLLNSTSGNVSGPVPSIKNDLNMYPLICLSFNSSEIETPLDLSVSLLPNGSFLLHAWDTDHVVGHGGFINSSLFKTCPIFWLGVNVVGPEYTNSFITDVFHSIRNPHQPFMIFPDNPDFGSYYSALIAGAIPFWAMAGLVVFLYAGVWCIRCVQMHSWWCCCTQPDATKSLAAAAKKESSEHVRPNPCPRLGRFFSWPCCAKCFKRTKPIEPQLSVSGAIAAKGTMEKYRKQIDEILSPQPLRRRLCFLCFSLFTFSCCIVLVVFSGLANSAEMSLSRDATKDVLTQSNALAYELLVSLHNTSTSLVRSENMTFDYVSQLQLVIEGEMRMVASYVITSNPMNLRILQLSSVLFFAEYTVAVEVVLYGLFFIVPVLILSATICSSCTFRYRERVLFERSSRCVGTFLRCYLIVVATLVWGFIMFFFYLVAISADVCFFPSIFYSNMTTMNDLQNVVFANTSLEIFNPASSAYRYYDPSSNNYLLDDINIATYFIACKATAQVQNPFSLFMMQAHTFNDNASVLAWRAGDMATFDQLSYYSQVLSNLTSLLTCGQPNSLSHQVYDQCELGITYAFMGFFFFIVLGFSLMFFIPCSRWVIPNLHRQWLANRVFDQAQMERAKKMTEVKSFRRGNSLSAAILTKSGSIKTLQNYESSFVQPKQLDNPPPPAFDGSPRMDQDEEDTFENFTLSKGEIERSTKGDLALL